MEEMDWIEKKRKLESIQTICKIEAKSALVFSFSYGPESNPLQKLPDKGYISIRAEEDYHEANSKKCVFIYPKFLI